MRGAKTKALAADRPSSNPGSASDQLCDLNQAADLLLASAFLLFKKKELQQQAHRGLGERPEMMLCTRNPSLPLPPPPPPLTPSDFPGVHECLSPSAEVIWRELTLEPREKQQSQKQQLWLLAASLSLGAQDLERPSVPHFPIWTLESGC